MPNATTVSRKMYVTHFAITTSYTTITACGSHRRPAGLGVASDDPSAITCKRCLRYLKQHGA